MARTHERLFERFRRRGDAAALGRVFDETAAELLRVALHLAPGPAEAEELLQDTYLAAIERADRFDAKRRLVPWLIGLMGIQERRARRARARRPDAERLPTAESSVDPVGDGELADRVQGAIGRVSDTLRPVLLLRLNHGLEPAEIANVLGEPPGTVRSKLHRGLAQLRERLPADARVRASLATPVLLGLDTIRANVMHSATQAASTIAASSGVAAALTLGGLVVTKTQLAFSVTAFAALLALGVVWTVIADRSEAPPARPPSGTLSGATVDSASPNLVGTAINAAPSNPVDGASMSPTAPPDGWRVEGEVRSARGSPIAGAAVRAYAYRGGIRETLGQGTSDARGRYVVSLEKLKALTPLMRQLAEVVVRPSAPGFAPAPALPLDAAPSSADVPYAPRVELRLARKPVIAGVVHDGRGRPVRRASVIVFTRDDRYAAEPVYTDAEGRYAVGIKTAGRYVVVAHSGLHGVSDPVDVSLTGKKTHEVAPLVLRAAHWIEGTVVFADGTPCAGLGLFTRNRQLDSDGRPVPASVRLVRWRAGFAVSGADGRFRMPVPIDGAYDIQAQGDFARAVRGQAHAGDRDVRVVVNGHAIRVRVQDDAGRALPGASVLLRGWLPQHADKLKDVEQGRVPDASSDFSLLEPAAGKNAQVDALFPFGAALYVSVNVDGYVPAEKSLRVSTKPGRTTLTLVMGGRPPTGTLALTVLAPDGTRIRDYGVSFLHASGSLVTHLRTDDNGVLPPAPAGAQRVSVLAGPAAMWMEERFQLASFYLPRSLDVTVPEGGIHEQTVRVRLGGRIRIAVDGPDEIKDKKLSSLRAHLSSVDGGAEEEPLLLSMFVVADGEELRLSGRFFAGKASLAAKLIEPGDYMLHAVAKGIRLQSQRVTVLAGEITDVTLLAVASVSKKR